MSLGRVAGTPVDVRLEAGSVAVEGMAGVGVFAVVIKCGWSRHDKIMQDRQ